MPQFRELRACEDCLIAIANADFTGLDDARAEEVQAGMERRNWLLIGDTANDDEFSSTPCDVCGTRLAGARHEVLEEMR